MTLPLFLPCFLHDVTDAMKSTEFDGFNFAVCSHYRAKFSLDIVKQVFTKTPPEGFICVIPGGGGGRTSPHAVVIA